MKSLSEIELTELPRVVDPRGSLTFLEPFSQVPFEVRRVFYTYDVPAGEDRGAHAHKACEQFLIAVSGSFEVVLDDGVNQRTYQLDRPSLGLYVPPGIWAAQQNFSPDGVCLVLANQPYDETDYIRNYVEYQRYIKGLHS